MCEDDCSPRFPGITGAEDTWSCTRIPPQVRHSLPTPLRSLLRAAGAGSLSFLLRGLLLDAPLMACLGPNPAGTSEPEKPLGGHPQTSGALLAGTQGVATGAPWHLQTSLAHQQKCERTGARKGQGDLALSLPLRKEVGSKSPFTTES